MLVSGAIAFFPNVPTCEETSKKVLKDSNFSFYKVESKNTIPIGALGRITTPLLKLPLSRD
jgi:hypothetical protein